MLELDESDYYSSLANISKFLLVLYISAPDCGPCRRMRPIVSRVQRSYTADGAVFANINKRVCPNICKEYKIDIVPSFMFIRGSKPFMRLRGSCSEEQLRNLISSQMDWANNFGL